MSTISSIPKQIVWAYELDPPSRIKAFKSFISREMTQLPEASRVRTEDRYVFIIGEKSGPKYLVYFNEVYCGPYKWDELPALFKDDKELCTSFFESLADEEEGLGAYARESWQGMQILLRYADLDEYTLEIVRQHDLAEATEYLLPLLLQEPPVDIAQDLLDHAFENILILLLGYRASEAALHGPGLMMDLSRSKIGLVVQCYFTLSSMDRHKMEFMCANFAEQLKEMEDNLLLTLWRMQQFSKTGSVSYKFVESKLELIVKVDIDRLVQGEGSPSHVESLSGESDLLLERWIKEGLEEVYKHKESETLVPVEMLFELYYCLRELPTGQKWLLAQRNEKLFIELEEYVLACLCNKYVSHEGDGYLNKARDREKQLSQAGNSDVLSPRDDSLRNQIVLTGDSCDEGSHGESVDAIVKKYWTPRQNDASKESPNIGDRSGAKNLSNNPTNQNPGFAGSKEPKRPTDDNPYTQIIGQTPNTNTRRSGPDAKARDNPDAPDQSLIPKIAFAVGLLLTMAVVVRYFMYGRSPDNALRTHYVFSAPGFLEGPQVSNHGGV